MPKLVVALGCATAVILAGACRQAPRPLEPDPQVARQIAKRSASDEFATAARAMTPQQVAGLEASLQITPEDAETRKKLQIFYKDSAPTALGWKETVAARRRHILWLIEHHPGDEATLAWGAIHPDHDPAGFAQARMLWLAQTAKADATTAVLSNAASFFETTDRPLAEQFLVRLEAMDPGGPKPRMKDNVFHPAWSARLGELYATSLAGISEGTWRSGDFKTSPEVARSPFAVEARQKLETTRNTAVLFGAAEVLRMWQHATAVACLERAAQLEPQNEVPRRLLASLRASEQRSAARDKLRRVPFDKRAAFVSALPDAERIESLPDQVNFAYLRADALEYRKHDPAAARVFWNQTRKLADDQLALCDKRPNDPHRSVALFSAHVVLAGLALHDNDTALALKHLDEAVKAPPSEELVTYQDGHSQRVLVGLLKRGERESVARFLDGYAKLRGPGGDYLRKWAAEIRAGKMPSFYQVMVTPS